MVKRVVVLAGLVLLVVVGLSVRGQAVVRVRYPKIQKALIDLQTTRAHLAKIQPKFGGHRTAAIRDIDVAIFELQQAMQYPPPIK
jgi:hypothetical protein